MRNKPFNFTTAISLSLAIIQLAPLPALAADRFHPNVNRPSSVPNKGNCPSDISDRVSRGRDNVRTFCGTGNEKVDKMVGSLSKLVQACEQAVNDAAHAKDFATFNTIKKELPAACKRYDEASRELDTGCRNYGLEPIQESGPGRTENARKESAAQAEALKKAGAANRQAENEHKALQLAICRSRLRAGGIATESKKGGFSLDRNKMQPLSLEACEQALAKGKPAENTGKLLKDLQENIKKFSDFTNSLTRQTKGRSGGRSKGPDLADCRKLSQQLGQLSKHAKGNLFEPLAKWDERVAGSAGNVAHNAGLEGMHATELERAAKRQEEATKATSVNAYRNAASFHADPQGYMLRGGNEASFKQWCASAGGSFSSSWYGIKTPHCQY